MHQRCRSARIAARIKLLSMTRDVGSGHLAKSKPKQATNVLIRQIQPVPLKAVGKNSWTLASNWKRLISRSLRASLKKWKHANSMHQPVKDCRIQKPQKSKGKKTPNVTIREKRLWKHQGGKIIGKWNRRLQPNFSPRKSVPSQDLRLCRKP